MSSLLLRKLRRKPRIRRRKPRKRKPRKRKPRKPRSPKLNPSPNPSLMLNPSQQSWTSKPTARVLSLVFTSIEETVLLTVILPIARSAGNAIVAKARDLPDPIAIVTMIPAVPVAPVHQTPRSPLLVNLTITGATRPVTAATQMTQLLAREPFSSYQKRGNLECIDALPMENTVDRMTSASMICST